MALETFTNGIDTKGRNMELQAVSIANEVPFRIVKRAEYRKSNGARSTAMVAWESEDGSLVVLVDERTRNLVYPKPAEWRFI